jgi:uncharacterized protein
MKPTTNNRIEVIDALRGFALLGIIITHCAGQYLSGPTPPSAGTLNLFSPLDKFFGEFLGYLTFGKFFTIFSFLFGLSFAIQMDTTSKTGRSFVGKTVWRLAILFLIGFIHSMFYSGDILMIYAILGLFLILFRNANNRVLVIVGMLLVFNAPLFIGRISSQFAPPPTKEQIEAGKVGGQAFMKQAEKQFQIKQSGTIREVVNMNLRGGLMGTLGFQIFTGRLFITLGLFLLGLWAGRKRIFIDNAQNRLFFTNLLRWSLVIALISTLSFILMGGIKMFEPVQNWTSFIKASMADVHQISLSAFLCGRHNFIVLENKICVATKLNSSRTNGFNHLFDGNSLWRNHILGLWFWAIRAFRFSSFDWSWNRIFCITNSIFKMVAQ